jgi:hypothetical protein
MGVIQLNRNRIGKVAEGLVVFLIVPDDVLQRGRNEEVLLFEPEFFSRCQLVARIEHF